MTTLLRHVMPLLSMLVCTASSAQVSVNEFSQGASGSKEFLELVVNGQRTCIQSCADIRGWIFDDNNGWYGTGASSAGFYRFRYDNAWSCIPYGALIVIYNPADLNAHLPADDPYDLNNDRVYVLPINHNLIEYNSAAAYSNAGFGPAADWSGLVFNNNNDAVQTIDPANLSVAYHAVSYGGALSAPVSLASGGAQTVYYANGSQYQQVSGWSKGNVTLLETPGAPNTAANAAWLAAMDSIQGPGPVTVYTQVSICPGDLPFSWNGIPVYVTGTNVAVYHTPSLASGCDSATILELVMLPEADSITIDTAGCGMVFFEGQSYFNTTAFRDTLYSGKGCDSLYRNIRITVHYSNTAPVVLDTAGCGSVLFEGVLYGRDTTLVQHFTGSTGCDSLIRTVHIIVDTFRLELALLPDTPFYKGEKLSLYAIANVPFAVANWQPLSLFPGQHSRQQSILAPSDETISVAGCSYYGCCDTATVSFRVLPLDYLVFIPNAFSPNGDGHNDLFVPRAAMSRAYHISRLQIFDRWGRPVYHSAGKDAVWNGKYSNGGDADAGTYHYRVQIRFADGSERLFTGDLTLLR